MIQPRVIRDLRWAIGSQSLIDFRLREPIGDWERRLSGLDRDHLEAVANTASSHRVGHYFERLILYWLVHIRNLDDVQHALQIREQNRTVGEIDFMFTDEAGWRTHWEVAVKFYLHFPGDHPSGSHFIGPNAGDNFEKKTERLLGHQLSMSVANFPDVELREPLVKGRIFYHPQRESKPELPEHLSPDHLRGTWIRESELDWLSQIGAESKFRVLRKPYWLADEIAPLADPSLLSSAAITTNLTKHFQETDRPVLVARLEQATSVYRECERVFVVSDRWPALTGLAMRRTSTTRV